jgi:hypothetical protein
MWKCEECGKIHYGDNKPTFKHWAKGIECKGEWKEGIFMWVWKEKDSTNLTQSPKVE